MFYLVFIFSALFIIPAMAHDAWVLEGETFEFSISGRGKNYNHINIEFWIFDLGEDSESISYTFDFDRSDNQKYSVLLPAGDYFYYIEDDLGQEHYISNLTASAGNYWVDEAAAGQTIHGISVVRLDPNNELIGVPDQLLVNEYYFPGMTRVPEFGWVHYGDGGSCSLSDCSPTHLHCYQEPGTYTVWAIGRVDGQWIGTKPKKVTVKKIRDTVVIPEDLEFVLPQVADGNKPIPVSVVGDLTGIELYADYYKEETHLGSEVKDDNGLHNFEITGNTFDLKIPEKAFGKVTVKFELDPGKGTMKLIGEKRAYSYDVIVTGFNIEYDKEKRDYVVCYYGEEGKPVTGWNRLKVDEVKKYFEGTGSDKEGTFYFQENGEMLRACVKEINGSKYYFDDSGVMAENKLINMGYDTYYFGPDGKMQTGWQTVDGAAYYFDADGKRTELHGDFNTDGVVDGSDVLHFMKYLAGEENEDGMPMELVLATADMNCDGTADEKDLLILMNYFAGNLQDYDKNSVLDVMDLVRYRKRFQK